MTPDPNAAPITVSYVASALLVAALWIVPLLLMWRHYHPSRCKPSNVVTFPRRDATVTRIYGKDTAS